MSATAASRPMQLCANSPCKTRTLAIVEVVTTYVLRSTQGDTGDVRDTLEVQLLDGLAGLLLIAGMDHSGRAGSAALARLDLRVRAFVVLLLLDRSLLRLLVGQLFNARVGHGCGRGDFVWMGWDGTPKRMGKRTTATQISPALVFCSVLYDPVLFLFYLSVSRSHPDIHSSLEKSVPFCLLGGVKWLRTGACGFEVLCEFGPTSSKLCVSIGTTRGALFKP